MSEVVHSVQWFSGTLVLKCFEGKKSVLAGVLLDFPRSSAVFLALL